MNLNNLDFNKLAVFAKVVEAGNYRLASEVLNVTPSALSQTITSLEHALGVPLFHRFGKKLVLTEIGAQIQREFQQHHQALTAGLGRLAGRNQLSGLIQIGAYLEFAKLQLVPLLTEFQKKYPDVQVKMVFDTPSRLHRLLEARKLDLCFSIYPERESRLIESRPVLREELVLVAPKHLLSERPSYEEIVAAPMIEYYFNHQPLRRWLALHFRKRPKYLPIRTFAATAEMVLALVRQGLGIGVIPEFLGVTDLRICRPTPKRLIDHIWVLRLKKMGNPVVDQFAVAVQEHFRLVSKLP